MHSFSSQLNLVDSVNMTTKKESSIRRQFLQTVRQLCHDCLPHVGLCTLYFLYLVLGGLVFSALEQPLYHELSVSEHAKIEKAEYARRTIIEAFHNASEGNIAGDEVNITALVDTLIDTVNHPDWKAGRLKTLMIGRDWSVPSAILFSMTTITTIGYGDLVPETLGGRIFCILYSVVGVPFSFLLLADIGQLLALAFIKLVNWIRKKIRRYRKRKMGLTRSQNVRRRKSPVHQRPNTSNVVMAHMQSMRRVTVTGVPGEDRDVVSKDSTVKGHSNATNEVPVDERGYVIGRSGSPMPNRREVSFGAETTTEFGMGDEKAIEMTDLSALPEDHNDQYNRGHYTKNGGRHQRSSPRETNHNNHHTPSDVDFHDGRKRDSSSGDVEFVDDDYLEEVPMLLVLVVLWSYICIGAYAFHVVEEWDYGTAIYFTFITLSTIGFGDVVPEKQYSAQTFFPFLIFTVLGLVVMSMCIALAQDKVTRGAKRLTKYIEDRRKKGTDEKDAEQGHSRNSQG